MSPGLTEGHRTGDSAAQHVSVFLHMQELCQRARFTAADHLLEPQDPAAERDSLDQPRAGRAQQHQLALALAGAVGCPRLSGHSC